MRRALSLALLLAALLAAAPALVFLLSTPVRAMDINSFRARHGLKPLKASAVLAAKAREHAADMARRQSMDHAGFYTRMRGAGTFAAENVAEGCASADCAFKAWAESAGHRANMLNPSLTDYGLASARGRNGIRYWALELAARDTRAAADGRRAQRPPRRGGATGAVDVRIPRLLTAASAAHFFSSSSCPRCPTTRCTAWAKRASSQGSVTSSRTAPS
jgi:hypothetical protein